MPYKGHVSAEKTKIKPKSPAVADEVAWEVPDAGKEALRRLNNRALSLAEDAPSPFDVAPPNPHGLRKGYDPYASGRLSKPASTVPAKKTDLRRLSEWMKLKKQHAKIKGER